MLSVLPPAVSNKLQISAKLLNLGVGAVRGQAGPDRWFVPGTDTFRAGPDVNSAAACKVDRFAGNRRVLRAKRATR